jgi:ribose transport system substrate-binding protein
MLSGVRMVLDKHKIDARSIIMIGCDYTSEAREAILKGTQTGSVLFPLGGKQAIDIARDIIAGKKVPKHMVIPVKLVTRENLEQVNPIF